MGLFMALECPSSGMKRQSLFTLLPKKSVELGGNDNILLRFPVANPFIGRIGGGHLPTDYPKVRLHNRCRDDTRRVQERKVETTQVITEFGSRCDRNHHPCGLSTLHYH
ncbi:hypothetical protein HRE53_11140 [Acaryochloris sp. 'Moss Beach']|uniref:hypothetical protein n=1 Tax=Acaryochloris sp. 'Moss Beach' TaxID=2740837 RepID=UPI001F271E7B|nr:hypothetical protein [Acaryochloris sp. 'Moss Beach']UJB71474.1 hypothetical protein HRE53_11140 [Acaryochloris sp. 'Moss Beach']